LAAEADVSVRAHQECAPDAGAPVAKRAMPFIDVTPQKQ